MSTKEIFYVQRYNRLKLMLGKSYIIQTQEIWRGSANIDEVDLWIENKSE